jgi:hypothetical protein
MLLDDVWLQYTSTHMELLGPDHRPSSSRWPGPSSQDPVAGIELLGPGLATTETRTYPRLIFEPIQQARPAKTNEAEARVPRNPPPPSRSPRRRFEAVVHMLVAGNAQAPQPVDLWVHGPARAGIHLTRVTNSDTHRRA